MVVREAGVMFRGFTLVKKTFHKTDKGKIDIDLRSGLLDAIMSFAESAFMKSSVEYFQGKKLGKMVKPAASKNWQNANNFIQRRAVQHKNYQHSSGT